MRTWWLTVAVLTSVGCTKTPAYLYGENITNVQFKPFSANMGVYPDTSILKDPNNPFETDPPTDTDKWVIQGAAGPVAGFYCWATILAAQQGSPGEDQYYAAIDLQQMFQEGKASADDLPTVRDLAIRSFQSVLDNFPTAVTYDATGTIAIELQTPSYQAIVALGGTVSGGWVLVADPNGGAHAVKP